MVVLDTQRRKFLGRGVHKPDGTLVARETCNAESVTDLSALGVMEGKKGAGNFDGSELGQALAFAQSLLESRPTAGYVVVPIFNATSLQFVRYSNNGDAMYSPVFLWTAVPGTASDAIPPFAQYLTDVIASTKQRQKLVYLVDDYRLVSHLGAGASGHVYGAVTRASMCGIPTHAVKVFGLVSGEPQEPHLQGKRAEKRLMSPDNSTYCCTCMQLCPFTKFCDGMDVWLRCGCALPAVRSQKRSGPATRSQKRLCK